MEMRNKAAEMLAKAEDIVLASVNGEGCPRPCVLSKIKSEGLRRVYVATGTESVKTKNFLANPRAGLCCREGEDSITLTGEVRVMTDPKTKREMWQDWFIEHFAGGVEDPGYCVLEFTAREAVLWIDGVFETVEVE